MIIDARTHTPDWIGHWDICIVGAGAAGLSIALEFIDQPNIRVLVLDAGGEEYDPFAQALFEGEFEGDRHAPPVRARMSGLGGSTNIWAGWCRPLDVIDFSARDWMPASGWPFAYDDLAPYYIQAAKVCGLGESDYSLQYWLPSLSGRPLLKSEDIKHPVFQVRRLNFASHYRDKLQLSRSVTVVSHAPVLRLRSSNESDRRVSVLVADQDKSVRTLNPKIVVLAAGGLENPRLLLLSGDKPDQAIGNQHDLVGRYFTEHGFADPGWFVPQNPFHNMQFYFPPKLKPGESKTETATVRPTLSLSEDLIKKEKLLNATCYFYPAYESHEIFTHSAVKSALEFWEIVKKRAVPEGQWPLLLEALRHPRELLHAIWRKSTIRGPQPRWRLRVYYECVPSADNRITLGEQKDAFGRPQLKLQWHLQPADIASVDRTCRLIDERLRLESIGHLELPSEPEGWRAITECGKHPMGTTRMADAPEKGVVDTDCRVFGTDNLYVAGSSVFPVVGYANPTLTIVALAIRLADKLKQDLSVQK